MFNHFVRIAGYPKPKAGFLTKHDAMAYAVWASRFISYQTLEVYFADGQAVDEPTDRYQNGRRL